ncbi:uncharacterized protein CANTADRAFT_87371 [Suhomyces tanzawaensis NRRL Y-17324]|uniref:Uncharacterized protein n=1 Tax=Suhomyces tanzawaensis NRRL Y-17324 TaxID=984487 RepID=A0A1E4SPL8_9ASCO|nr:uncharacterized protein CANTADRAFT_87371 [Suhomyces tanzawaensis NRRL Y-17324]ODV81367.1 hypothetical protein CANTADRAFT_87371 [Suhomyces tanzawaensis NRRL Y-17324]
MDALGAKNLRQADAAAELWALIIGCFRMLQMLQRILERILQRMLRIGCSKLACCRGLAAFSASRDLVPVSESKDKFVLKPV